MANTSYCQQSLKRPTSSLNSFGMEINYYRYYFSGIKVISFGYMELAFPNLGHTDVLAKIEQLSTNQNVQDRFFYIAYKKNGSKKADFKDMLYLLSKDASASVAISDYYINRFSSLASIKDLRIQYDKIQRDQDQKALKKKLDDEQKALNDYANKKADSLNALVKPIDGTKQYLNLSELLEFIRRDRFPIDEIKGFMSQHSSLDWDVKAFTGVVYITWDNDDSLNYFPQKHTIEIETINKEMYEFTIQDIEMYHPELKKITYSHKLNNAVRTDYKNEKYIISCETSPGGSMGNTNYQITISRVQDLK